MFDTVGLAEPHLRTDEYPEAIVNARSLTLKLYDEGGIDLLLFCVRAGRFSAALQNNYRLFFKWLCEKVPIALVLAGLEGEKDMDDRRIRHKDTFDKYNVVIDDHPCITAANKLDGRHQELYQLSCQLVRYLVREHTHGRPAGG